MATKVIKEQSVAEFQKSRLIGFNDREERMGPIITDYIGVGKEIPIRKYGLDPLAISEGDTIRFDISEKTQITRKLVTCTFEYLVTAYDDISFILKPIKEEEKNNG